MYNTQPATSEPWLELFKSAVEQSYDAVLITNAELERPGPYIVYANPAFERTTGYTPQEVIGHNPKFLQGPETDPEVIARLREALIAGETFHGQAVNYKKDNAPFLMEWTISPVHNRHGTLTHFVALQRDVTEHQRMIDSLRQHAIIDGLTEVYDRRETQRLLDGELTRSQRYQRDLAVVMIDVDNFKTLNDAYGHTFGDGVLKAFSKLISARIRSTDIVGRWGGEEFVMILPETDAAGASLIAKELRARIADEPLTDAVQVTASFGVAATRGGSWEQLVADVDAALYRAKANGRNAVAVSEPLFP